MSSTNARIWSLRKRRRRPQDAGRGPTAIPGKRPQATAAGDGTGSRQRAAARTFSADALNTRHRSQAALPVGSEAQARDDVVVGELREVVEKFGFRHSTGEVAKYIANRHPRTADNRLAETNPGIDVDSSAIVRGSRHAFDTRRPEVRGQVHLFGRRMCYSSLAQDGDHARPLGALGSPRRSVARDPPSPDQHRQVRRSGQVVGGAPGRPPLRHPGIRHDRAVEEVHHRVGDKTGDHPP